MKTKNIIIVFLITVLMPSLVFAAPVISRVTGYITHTSSITISGAEFGSKEPASPLVWDDGTSSPSLNTYYDAWLPTQAGSGSEYNMAYRLLPYREVGSPHQRINYALAGAHAETDNINTYFQGGNVGVGINMNSHEYFISYWYRLNPLFDQENHPTYGENLKELVLSNREGEFYVDFSQGERHGYYAWCVNTVPNVSFTGDIRLFREPIEAYLQQSFRDAPYSCSYDSYITYHNNPINGWVKMQWEGTYVPVHNAPKVKFTTYPDGAATEKSHYGGDITSYEYSQGEYIGYPKEDDLRFVGIGGFSRIPKQNNGINSFRYFTGIYIDGTHSRIMLGDNANYDSCTMMEPQIPSAWNGNSITADVNLGALPDSGTAYLFVFDADNNHNEVGFPVSIGGGSGDTIAPNAPGGLSVR